MPTDDMAAVLARLENAANDPTYSSPRVRRADIFAALRAYDTLVRLAHRDCDRCAADDCDACTDTTDGQRPCYCPHRFAAQAARLTAAEAGYRRIREQYGQVCDEYLECNHRSCASSYGAWATADEWLAAGAAGEGRADG